MRIIAGRLGGRRIVAPRGDVTRPTSDRVREALFSILGAPGHDDGHPFRVLDLFAGSGALGLEAVSRGVDLAVLVDEDRDAFDVATKNVAALGVGDRVRVLRSDAGKALRTLAGERFDWIFLDPPYTGGALDRALRLVGDARALAEGGTVIAEHDAKAPPDDAYGKLALSDRRAYGQTALSFYQVTTVTT